MALSTAFDKSIHFQYIERSPLFPKRDSGCMFANLVSQSLSMYVELEKIHWHLRLSSSRDPISPESVSTIEIAREASAISLHLVSSISRLQSALDLDVSSECAAVLAAVEEKIAEICALASEGFDFTQQATTRTLQGPRGAECRFLDAARSDNANMS